MTSSCVEREDIPGGRAGMIRGSHGFSLDNGPTVLTMPDLLEEAFIAAGDKSMSDHVTIKPVDPMYRACYADGSTLLRAPRPRGDDRGDPPAFANDKEAAEAFGRFSDWLAAALHPRDCARTSSTANSRFAARPDQAVEVMDSTLLQAGRVRSSWTRRSRPSSTIERLQQIFSFQSMYAGLAPYEALAIYAVITYMDSVAGCVSCLEGGMHADG